MISNDNVLEVQDLKTHFYTSRGVVKAVDGVSFALKRGEALGLVGESGCGKSITCFSLIRLVPRPAGRIVGGKVLLEGEDLLTKNEKEMTKIRGKRITMILQDPMMSLNPVFTIGEQITETIRVHQKLGKMEIWEKVKEMLRLVRIPSPEVRMREYPHQMSGGMRQRISGAIALSCQPSVLIADEATTALDVTIQAQFLSLFKEIQEQANLSMIVVTHDFGIVARACDRVAVMYAGKIVENAETRELFNNPAHPYTIALLNSLPKMEMKVDTLYSIEGQPPELHALPPGCSFAPRCSHVMEICQREYPPQKEVAPGHFARCWLKG
ncbi:MAG: ABC transporter ATP-binding protein [Syntrophales bacterium]|jgi:oligopeptide/dipeptide ABC transporter ATP-binding protein|nr:ABC transporter ATP-binding protein [Syntrophales bacterium]MDY0045288.1 ABC transporter ATP-binding protein [Syntrophales bacterium]